MYWYNQKKTLFAALYYITALIKKTEIEFTGSFKLTLRLNLGMPKVIFVFYACHLQK